MKFISAIAFIACCIPALAFAQEKDPLGSGLPVSYKVQDLPNEYVGIEIGTSKDSLRSLMFMGYRSMAIAPENGNSPALSPELLYQLTEIVWTNKEMPFGTSEYMIGYRLELPAIPSMPNVDLDKVKYRLTYVKRASIISLTPREEFSPSAIKELFKQEPKPVGTVADRTATLSNLKQASTAMLMFLSDVDDIVPYVQSTPQLFKMLEPYARNMDVFKTKNPMGGAIRFNMSLAGVNSAEIENPAATVLFYESEPWADGKRCVAYADSHAKVVDAAEWEKLQPTLKLKMKKHGKPLPPDQIVPQVK